jgi:hypothetical protein
MSLRIRILLTIAALLLLPTYSALAGSDDTSIRISISPTGGPAETNIAVTGTGAQPDMPVQIMFTTNGDTDEGALNVWQIDPESSGDFAATITVPPGTSSGAYAVRAVQHSLSGGVVQYYWVSFQIGDVLVPETGGVPDTSLTVSAILAALLVGLLVFQGARRASRQ